VEKRANMKKEYCLLCNDNVDIIIKEELLKYEHENEIIEYVGKQAYCSNCGEKIYVEELAKYNREKILEKIWDYHEMNFPTMWESVFPPFQCMKMVREYHETKLN
jgi:hypothetical protein